MIKLAAMQKIVIDAREIGTTTGRYIENLLEELQEIDTDLTHRYYILMYPKTLATWQPKSKRFIKVACRFKEFTFGEQLGLLWQLLVIQPDLVHFGMVQQPILYMGKVVTTMHDLTTLRFDNPSKNPLVFRFKQQVYQVVNFIAAHKSKAVIVPTEFVKDDVARTMRTNSRKITVTYEAGDKIGAKAEPLPELTGTQFILYVGRPNPHKNLARLIEAYALLKQTMPHVHLVLAGRSDALFKRFERDVERGNIPDVHFTDRVSDGQLRWLYEHAAVYVFPSLSEGFGLPGLEAMANDAPVASSNATCLPEVYGNAAHYFNPVSVDDIAAKVKDILTDEKLRKQLVARGHKQVAKYSWRRMAQQTLDIYKSILNEP